MWFHLAHALSVFWFWIGTTQAANPTSFATIDRSGCGLPTNRPRCVIG